MCETFDEQHEDIKDFVKGTVADSAPIVPISAQLRYNIGNEGKVRWLIVPKDTRSYPSLPPLHVYIYSLVLSHQFIHLKCLIVISFVLLVYLFLYYYDMTSDAYFPDNLFSEPVYGIGDDEE